MVVLLTKYMSAMWWSRRKSGAPSQWDCGGTRATSVVGMARELARFEHDISQSTIAPVASGLEVFERAPVNDIYILLCRQFYGYLAQW